MKTELEKQLMEEVSRFKEIGQYAKNLLNEQEIPDEEIPADVDAEIPPVDDESMDLPPVDDMSSELPTDGLDTEEIDITDLVNMTKSIKMDLENNDQGQTVTKMDDMFTKLKDLEDKLSQMDVVLNKIDELGNQVSQMKDPTPEEKLEMRSLDSYPFNQNPQEFFSEKQGEMKASGKNDYVLSKQDVDNYSKEMIRKSFSDEEDEYGNDAFLG